MPKTNSKNQKPTRDDILNLKEGDRIHWRTEMNGSKGKRTFGCSGLVVEVVPKVFSKGNDMIVVLGERAWLRGQRVTKIEKKESNDA